MKNPPRQSAWRVSESFWELASSLAVFYVEQVALNRHVSPQPQLVFLCTNRKKMSRTNRPGRGIEMLDNKLAGWRVK